MKKLAFFINERVQCFSVSFFLGHCAVFQGLPGDWSVGVAGTGKELKQLDYSCIL